MKFWLWIAATVLFLVVAASAWFAFQRPDFVVGFIVAALASAYNAIKPALLKRKLPEEEAKDRDAYLKGISRGRGSRS